MNTGNERTAPRGAARRKWVAAAVFSAVLVFSAAAVLAATRGARAASVTKQIEAAYMDIKIVLFGNEITPTDVNGTPVEPFAIDG
ncbi:MAG: hypothetical protein LBC28_00160, partial [Oscillospiraceae bacterium]|nr:hypothetical protein [Oscillospiraceae bacterium]